MTTHQDVGSRISFIGARADDAEALVALRLEAMRESLERVGRFDPQRARERFLGAFAPEYTKQIVLEGECVGFVVVKPSESGLLLDHLYIHPRFQRRGIGTDREPQVHAYYDTHVDWATPADNLPRKP